MGRSLATIVKHDEEFQRALSALQTGNLKDAERRFKNLVRDKPQDVAALNLLGLVLGRLGRNVEAVDSYDRALALAPNSFESWFGRGMTLIAAARHQDAIASFDRAIAAKPDITQVHLLRAKLLTDLDRYDEALAGVDKLLAMVPGLAEAWLGRSNILFEVKRYDEALAACERALALTPSLTEAWHGRGNVLNELKRHDDALAAYDKALALNPHFAGAWHGRGNVLGELKCHDDALAAYDRALALRPDLVEAWLGRGNISTGLNRYNEAFTAFDRALAINPGLAEAWLGRGNVFLQLNQHHDALIAYDKALSLSAGLAEAWVGRGNVFAGLKQFDNALAAYDRALALKPDVKYVKGDRLHAKLHLGDWTDLVGEVSALVSAVREGNPASAPFPFLSIASSLSDQWQCSKCFIADQPSFPAIWRGEVYFHDRIRVAYLSADFHEHATAYLMAGLFEHHDKSRFETTAISFGPDDGSPMRSRIRSAFDDFIDVQQMGDDEVARLIRRREIDIAVDLKGFTRDCRFGILARRAAPIQINYLGYPGTMGADCIDYILADPTIIPDDHWPFYREQVVWLPDSYQANDGKRLIAERVPTRQQCALPEAAFVFCCFNNTFKISPEVFSVWMRLLCAKQNSVLWLLEANSTVSINLRREAEKHSVSSDRLIFAPRLPLADHLARHRNADLFLDTLPYNAHTTASDALWAGLPVLTCLGATFAGRVAASLIKAVGLDELITHSLEDYEALALKIASDPSSLAAIKDRLARNRSTFPLFNTERMTRQIEVAYMTMWERYQRGEGPRAFRVDRPN
jgi:protein O-GlcNAc transferase